jgi:hypothetical protein
VCCFLGVARPPVCCLRGGNARLQRAAAAVPPQSASKFATLLEEAAAGAGVTVALPLPEPRHLAAALGRGGSAKSLTRAAANPELVAHFAAALGGWCDALEGALNDGAAAAAGKGGEDAGELLCCWGRVWSGRGRAAAVRPLVAAPSSC